MNKKGQEDLKDYINNIIEKYKNLINEKLKQLNFWKSVDTITLK